MYCFYVQIYQCYGTLQSIRHQQTSIDLPIIFFLHIAETEYTEVCEGTSFGLDSPGFGTSGTRRRGSSRLPDRTGKR